MSGESFTQIHYSNFLKGEHADLSIRDALGSSVGRLVGVDDDDVTALARLGIETIHDLATAPLFERARDVTMAAAGNASPMSNYGYAPASLVTGDEPRDVTELVNEDITAIAGTEDGVGAELIEATGLQTVRDYSHWSPFVAARSILEQFGGGQLDPDSNQPPAELQPVARQYNTEKVFYEKVFLDDVLEMSNPDTGSRTIGNRDIVWPGHVFFPGERDTERERADSSLPVQIDGSATPNGFEKPAIGAVLSLSQSWTPEGLSLGNLLHSTSLAPGEMTRMAVLDWERRSSASTDEDISQVEQLSNTQRRSRAIDETQYATATEFTTGSSSISSDSESGQSSGSAGLGFSGGGFTLGASGSTSSARTRSKTRSVSSSSGRRGLAASMGQRLSDLTQQNASSTRSRRASIVSEVGQSESVEAKTRVVTNYNHMHPLNLHYYEVVQMYRTEVGPEEADPVIYIPFDPIDFNQRIVRQHRSALLDAALDTDTHRLLRNAFGKSTVTLSQDLSPDELSDAASEERVYARIGVDGSLGDGEWSVPSDAEITGFTAPTGDPTEKPIETVFIDRHGDDRLEIDLSNGNTSVPDRLAFSDIRQVSVSFDEDADTSNADRFELNLRVMWEGEQDSIVIRGRWDGQGNASSWPLLHVDRPIEFTELVDTLMDDQLYYSQAVWADLGQETLALLLKDVPLLGRKMATELIEPTSVATYGNLVGFPLVLPEPIPIDQLSEASREAIDTVLTETLQGVDLRGESVRYGFEGFVGDTEADQTLLTLVNWWGEWRNRNYDPMAIDEEMVALPSEGVHMEAILGRANAAEKLDITRFWDWQESPIPFAATEIAPVDTGSRATDDQVTPGSLDAPIVNIQSPQSAPDPTGIGAILNALSTADLFRDMAGLKQTATVTQNGQQATSDAATDAMRATTASATQFGEIAGKNYRADLQAEVEKVRALAGLAGAADGSGGRTISTNSGFGALLNETSRNTPQTASTAGERSDRGSNGSTGSASGSDLREDMLRSKGDPVGRATDAVSRFDDTEEWYLQNAVAGDGAGEAEDGEADTEAIPTCYTNVPESESTLVLDETEHSVPDLEITNWKNDDVLHFTPPRITCRSADDVSEIIVHETDSMAWEEDNMNRMQNNKNSAGKDEPLSVHFVIRRDGTVVQHNDVMQRLVHGGPHNTHSVAIDIVNDPDPKAESTVTDSPDDFLTTKWNTEAVAIGSHKYPYRLPTEAQMKSLHGLVEFLTSRSEITIPVTWPGVVSDQRSNREDESFFMFYNVPSLNKPGNTPGILAHGHYGGGGSHIDGYFGTVYLWLRLTGGQSHGAAWQNTMEFCENASWPADGVLPAEVNKRPAVSLKDSQPTPEPQPEQ